MAALTDWGVAHAEPFADWVRSGTNLPVLPDLATKVIALASDPDATAYQLTGVISKDQVLATRLLSLANSAYSAPAVEITTIADAVMRVGANGVRNLAVTVCFASRMHDRDVYGAHGQALVDHGVGTAYLAHLIAEQAGADPDEAFLCGLLHDIGKLVMLKWFHTERTRTGQPLDEAVMWDFVARWHPAAAVMAFRRWRVPEQLDEPVACHHDFTLAKKSPALSAVVYLANQMSHRYGFGCPADGRPVSSDPVAEFLELETPWFDEVDRRAPGLYAVARRILG